MQMARDIRQILRVTLSTSPILLPEAETQEQNASCLNTSVNSKCWKYYTMQSIFL